MNRVGLGTALCLGLAALLAGCETPEGAKGAKSLLSLWQPPSPLEAAEMAVDPWDADARAKGTMLLANGYFGGEDPYHQLYIERAGDKDPNVRAAAMRGLTLHGRPEDVPLITQALADPNSRVRLEAARTLQRLYNPEAIDELIVSTRAPEPGNPARTGESEPQIRAEAAGALGQYSEPRVLQPLIAALDDRFLAVNLAAEHSLRTLTGQDFGVDRKAWLRWYEESDDHFSGRTAYEYPFFHRGKFFWEYIPFVPPPPNETAGVPVGYPPSIQRQDQPISEGNG
ncbi:MAG: HEAT repeat domain-containing protein [Phycisphaerales bacterium]|nr:HEAT repeat domain-containing protein [Phycisphaerales bacterium]